MVKHFLLAQNLVGSCHYFNPPLWSVAVEMIAYLAFPIFIILRMGWLSMLLIGSILYGIFYSFAEPIDSFNGFFSILRCLAGFLCGVAAAKTTLRNSPDAIQIPLVLLLIYAIAMNYQIIAICLMFVVTILTAQNTGIIARVSQMKLPYLIGRSSFSIYLAHYPVAMVVIPVAYKFESLTDIPLGNEWKVMMPLEILVSSVVGIIAYALIERRFENFFQIGKGRLQAV